MNAPLAGLCVLVTRPAHEGELSDLLRSEGAEVLEGPAIETLPLEDPADLDRAVKDLADGGFEWAAFSSPRAVHAVVERLAALELGPGIGAKVAAVGPSTARALRQAGLPVHTYTPSEVSASLNDAIEFPRSVSNAAWIPS